MGKINVIFPKNYDFNGVKTKLTIEVAGVPVVATIIRSTFTSDGAHMVLDIPKEIDADEFIKTMSQDGARAYVRALVTVDENECIQCGECCSACAYNALTLDADFNLVVNKDNCTGCRTCVDACPRRCITVY
nr:4Fe-4S binding protein [Candidatus Sigynarchaeota archaeon]